MASFLLFHCSFFVEQNIHYLKEKIILYHCENILCREDPNTVYAVVRTKSNSSERYSHINKKEPIYYLPVILIRVTTGMEPIPAINGQVTSLSRG